MTANDTDVLVVGGGAAGLNAAVQLARARVAVLVVDAGSPRNAPAAGIHGFLGHDGVAPRDLLAAGRAEVRHYGGRILDGEVRTARSVGTAEHPRFEVDLVDGTTLGARRLVVTSGLVDVLPEIPGLAERFGRDVVHCPFCHGWEIRDRAIGVLGTGPMAVHQALLFSQWSDDVVLLQHRASDPSPEDLRRLAARGVRVVAGEVQEVLVRDDVIEGVRVDGVLVPRDALAVAPRFACRADFLADLGLVPVEHPTGMGTHLPVEGPTGATSVRGVVAAGNLADPMVQVVQAAGAGAMAGAYLVMDLVLESADAR